MCYALRVNRCAEVGCGVRTREPGVQLRTIVHVQSYSTLVCCAHRGSVAVVTTATLASTVRERESDRTPRIACSYYRSSIISFLAHVYLSFFSTGQCAYVTSAVCNNVM